MSDRHADVEPVRGGPTGAAQLAGNEHVKQAIADHLIGAGDEVVATIEKIGTMRVRVRAAEGAPVAEAGVAAARMT